MWRRGLNDGWGLNYFSKRYYAKQALTELKKATEFVDTGKQLLKGAQQARSRPIFVRDTDQNIEQANKKFIVGNVPRPAVRPYITGTAKYRKQADKDLKRGTGLFSKYHGEEHAKPISIPLY